MIVLSSGRARSKTALICTIGLPALLLALFLCLSSSGATAANSSANNSSKAVTDAVEPGDQDIVPSVLIQGYVYKCVFTASKRIPVAGASICLINQTNNTTVFYTATSAVGYYSFAVQPGLYTRIVSAPGFETLIDDVELTATKTEDLLLFPVPFNGFVPYALYPVLETSPGHDVTCSILIENYQVSDQMVTVSIVTPEGWEAWFPLGEAVMVRSGYSALMPVTLRYAGCLPGPHTMKVVVNGGAYSAEIPVIVVVKDLPYETLDFYSNSPLAVVKNGTTAWFQLSIKNNYATGKTLKTCIESPFQAVTENPDMITNTGNVFHVYKNDEYTYWLRVYVPNTTKQDDYPIRLWMEGDNARSNDVYLVVRVDETPGLLAKCLDKNGTECGFFNCSTKSNLTFRFQVQNKWMFPVKVQPHVWMDDENSSKWSFPYYSSTGRNDQQVYLAPNDTDNITFTTSIPDVEEKNYTVRYHIVSTDDVMGEYVDSCEGNFTIHVYPINTPSSINPLSLVKGPDAHDALTVLLVLTFTFSMLLPGIRRFLKK